MALTVEDGTNVAGADSYATLAEIRAYCEARGLTLSATDATVEAQARKAMDVIEALATQFKGRRTHYDDQPLSWPRTGVYVLDSPSALDSDEIPQRLKDSQARLTYDASVADLQPTGAGREVVSETVDVLSVSYNPQGTTSVVPVTTAADAILAPLLTSGGALAFSTMRV